jgi:hypothetical protein
MTWVYVKRDVQRLGITSDALKKFLSGLAIASRCNIHSTHLESRGSTLVTILPIEIYLGIFASLQTYFIMFFYLWSGRCSDFFNRLNAKEALNTTTLVQNLYKSFSFFTGYYYQTYLIYLDVRYLPVKIFRYRSLYLPFQCSNQSSTQSLGYWYTMILNTGNGLDINGTETTFHIYIAFGGNNISTSWMRTHETCFTSVITFMCWYMITAACWRIGRILSL